MCQAAYLVVCEGHLGEGLGGRRCPVRRHLDEGFELRKKIPTPQSSVCQAAYLMVCEAEKLLPRALALAQINSTKVLHPARQEREKERER